MRITIFNGSPHKEQGNTHIMVEAFTAGAEEAGAEVETIFLAGRKINPCIGCLACWFKTPGQCIHRDAMDELLPKITTTDVVGLATPLYVDNVSGIMKNFMDRLIPLVDPHMEPDEHGETRHIRVHDKPQYLLAISNCGFPEQSHFEVLRVLFRRVARNMSCRLLAEFYRGGGPLLSTSNPNLLPFVEQYKMLLHGAGSEMVRNLGLSKETIARLEQPLMPNTDYAEVYRQRINQRFDERLAEAGHL
jgi:NAD(P)H-dependent FMN reductase